MEVRVLGSRWSSWGGNGGPRTRLCLAVQGWVSPAMSCPEGVPCHGAHSKLPSWARAVTPRIFYITEKAWNYYPYTITGGPRAGRGTGTPGHPGPAQW